MSNDVIITRLLGLQNQLKILHWQTKKYARHMAYGDTYETLEDLIDTFIEIYQGKFDRIILEDNKIITIKNINDESLDEFISENIDFMNGELISTLNDQDTDLLNIRDEMVAALNKLRYLVTLN